MVETICGILAIIAGCAQLFLAWRYFRGIQTSGDASTPPFSLMALWSGGFFGVILIGFGVTFVLHLI
jgi:hypothetical protein